MDLNNTTAPPDEADYAQTPRSFFDALQLMFGVVFDLDVCANAATAKCEAFYSLEERGLDGLALPWAPLNWCNPPYSDIMPWVEKAAAEALQGNTTYMLIPNKPEVNFCRAAFATASHLKYLPYRLNFLRPDGSRFRDAQGKGAGPKFPVYIVIFSPERTSEWRRPVIDYIDPRPYIDRRQLLAERSR